MLFSNAFLSFESCHSCWRCTDPYKRPKEAEVEFGATGRWSTEREIACQSRKRKPTRATAPRRTPSFRESANHCYLSLRLRRSVLSEITLYYIFAIEKRSRFSRRALRLSSDAFGAQRSLGLRNCPIEPLYQVEQSLRCLRQLARFASLASVADQSYIIAYPTRRPVGS